MTEMWKIFQYRSNKINNNNTFTGPTDTGMRQGRVPKKKNFKKFKTKTIPTVVQRIIFNHVKKKSKHSNPSGFSFNTVRT